MSFRPHLPLICLASTLLVPACATPGDGEDDGDEEVREATWHQGVAPMVHEHCVGCHSVGGVAPFSMETYEQAKPWASVMLAEVDNGTMPPWGAIDTDECEHPAAFEHDPRLSEPDMDLLAEWVDAGAPEGDPETALPLPEAPDVDLAEPDGVFTPPGAFEVDGDEDLFWCATIDPAIGEDAWLTGLQLQPGNAKVVHHVLFFTDPGGESAELANGDGYYECFGGAGIEDARLIGGYIPGAMPMVPPADTGIPIAEGSRIVMSFHYHPTGAGAELDQSALALEWTTERPRYEAGFELVGNFEADEDGLLPGPNDEAGEPEFFVPANTKGHTERMEWGVPEDLDGDVYLWSIANHMHYIGVDQLTQVERADGSQECLLHTPRWDFDWQRVYEYAGELTDMPRVRGGETLSMRCTYDNTMDNPLVRRALAEQGLDAPVDVYLGDGSLDEMCIVALGFAYEP